MGEFRFKSEVWTSEYTGIKANTIHAFLKALRHVHEDVIYYHLYRNIFEFHYLPLDYANSFAYWMAENGYYVLAEKLSVIDPLQYTSLEDIRHDIIRILEDSGEDLDVLCSKPFYFIRAVRMAVDLNIVAKDLESFVNGLKKIGWHSLFYHLVTARLKLGKPINDFSLWFESIGEIELAREIEKVNLWAHTLREVKGQLISIVERKLYAH